MGAGGHMSWCRLWVLGGPGVTLGCWQDNASWCHPWVLEGSIGDTPPPTHGCCGRRRMQGWTVLWVPGTDHAGIATQVRPKRVTLPPQKSVPNVSPTCPHRVPRRWWSGGCGSSGGYAGRICPAPNSWKKFGLGNAGEGDNRVTTG